MQNCLEHVNLCNINPNNYNTLIVGIIIAKQRPRKFDDRKSNDDANLNKSRAVWNFTLRETRQDYVNANYWGEVDLIFEMNNKFHVGDVVEVHYPKILIRNSDDRGELYRPMVTSPYLLSLGQRSSVILHEAPDLSPYLSLLRYPTKPLAGFVPLRDVQNNGASLTNTVDILGAIKGIGATRQITTGKQEVLEVREIEIFDTSNQSIKISLWDPEIIAKADAWKPRETLLFLTDVKIVWSGFQRAFTVSLTSRTIITENPIGEEASKLSKFAATAAIETYEIADHLLAVTDLSLIQDTMCIKQIHEKINEIICGHQLVANQQFTALIYAFVAELDLDGQMIRLLNSKCSLCKKLLKNSETCDGPGCPASISGGTIIRSYNIPVMLTDHTATLTSCRLVGKAAETVLQCPVEEFVGLSETDKWHLKWKYLLEFCAVRIVILISNQQFPFISILGLERADRFEAAERMPFF